MKKDFLCLDYSWVKNSRFIFDSLSKIHSVDIVDEKTINNFNYADDYSNIIIYLHEPNTLPYTNSIINHYKNATIIQHDDTDFEDIQIWTPRSPSLVMQRELTVNSNNPWGCEARPHHFPISSLYDPEYQDKQYDVFFMGTLTNSRRLPFIKKLIELSQGKLKNLKWKLMITPTDVRTPDEYKKALNSSKIGLHFLGNSYDSWRIWEIASCGTALLMPKLPLLSISENYMPLRNQINFKDDFSDLDDKILSLLDNDCWKDVALKLKEEYDTKHTPEKCFLSYYKNIKDFIK